jgi:tRNA threonylcarbamoyl adenosine modification protein YeaZ
MSVLVLAVDTATPAVTAGLVRHTQNGPAPTVPDRVVVDPRGHVERLMTQVGGVLADLGVTYADLGAVVCGCGPGPFTGLRVGMVTAGALGDALDIPVYAVSSLLAIAAVSRAERLAVVTDARRKEVYSYLRTPTGAVGPAVSTPARLRSLLDEADIDQVVGQGALMYADVLGRTATGHPYPSALGLVLAAEDLIRSGAPSSELTPLYLRAPDAVEPGALKRVSVG